MKTQAAVSGAVVAAALRLTSSADAQLVPLSDEAIVNTQTTGRQSAPAVASDGIGNYIVVWESVAGVSPGEQAVRGRRFSAAGTPLGDEFQIGTRASGSGALPDVAMAPDGSFVVAWRDYDDNSDPRIVARVFESTGAPRGQPAFVDKAPEGGGWDWCPPFDGGSCSYGGAPAAAAGQAGEFVVVWSGGLEYPSYFGYSRYFTIRGRRLDPEGSPVGDEFHVGGSGFYWTRDPDVAEQKAGEFVVVWSEARYEYGYDNGDYIRTRHFNVLGRVVNRDGAAVSDRFAVGPGDGYAGSSVAADSGGNFIVAWPRFEDDNGYSLLARAFDATAAPTSDSFRVDSGASGTPGEPTNAGSRGSTLAMTSDGHFTIVWSEGGGNSQGNSDGDAAGIFGRAYNPDGGPQSSEFAINAYTTGSQHGPAAAFANDQSLIVAWQSEDQDDSDSAIVARRFARAAACGDATADGQSTATDALFALQSAVGALECAPCICDVDGSGSVTALDALAILRSSLGGEGIVLSCPACP